MKPATLAAAWLAVVPLYAAAQSPSVLPTVTARALLEQDPRVASAVAALEAARLEAGLLERSPYEWTAKGTAQQRRLDMGPTYREWNATIERPWRLPGKGAADKDLAKATLAEAEARHGEAVHEAARDLAGLWLDWLGAEHSKELSRAMVAAVEENLEAVRKRVRAGDASRLDASLAEAELAAERRAANDIETQAAVARAKLKARFPAAALAVAPLPEAVPLERGLEAWRARVLEQSDELKIAQAQLEKAKAQAARARAERIPDPTVGLYAANEVGGQERIVGLTLSIPIPGGLRSARADRAVRLQEAAVQQLELKKRELEAEIAADVASAEGMLRTAGLAEASAAAMRDNAKLVQRAYSLGEADLQTLLNARRQAAAAAQGALAARIAAVKAHHLLLVDAHLVWDLDRE